MGKKNKIKDAGGAVENVAEPLDPENDVPSVKRKSKKQSHTGTNITVATNGNALDDLKRDKKKKCKRLPADKSNAEDKESKHKKKKLKDATTQEDEQIISFKKPNKKRSVEPENTEEDVPTKVSKSDGNLITAGTTIDQVVGIKLKDKKGKREKKREKHATLVEEQKKKSKEKEREEIRQYLNCWSTNREQWKFHKLQQIHIQDHVFDEDEIDADLWPTALEYLSGTKGSSRDVLMKRAESIIRDGDAAAAENGDETLQASSKYERARELLQCLG